MHLLIVTQKIDKDDENLGSFHRWVEEFAKRVSHVTVIASFVGNYSFPNNVSVFSFGKDKGVGKLRRIWKYWELFSFHYAHANAVFFHMIPEYINAATPFLISRKRPSALWYVHKMVTPLLERAERRVDYIFTASDLSFRLASKKVLYTGHGIDTRFFKPEDRGQHLIASLRLVTVGRISPIKDIETIIRACAVLKENWDREFTFSIIGGPLMARDEEYLASLKKLVYEKHLENRILFLGAHAYSDIASVYRDYDMFISMSTTGSIDKSVLEAMASGLTVLTANEAFQSLLPPPYFLEKRSPDFAAERIKTLAGETRPNRVLRERVIKNHSLEHVIETIVARLS
jgi:glycosyltransferase involved in cell wall biosynthesis